MEQYTTGTVARTRDGTLVSLKHRTGFRITWFIDEPTHPDPQQHQQPPWQQKQFQTNRAGHHADPLSGRTSHDPHPLDIAEIVLRVWLRQDWADSDPIRGGAEEAVTRIPVVISARCVQGAAPEYFADGTSTMTLDEMLRDVTRASLTPVFTCEIVVPKYPPPPPVLGDNKIKNLQEVP